MAERICKICGKEFETKCARQKYCNLVCTQRASMKAYYYREKEKKNG